MSEEIIPEDANERTRKAGQLLYYQIQTGGPQGAQTGIGTFMEYPELLRRRPFTIRGAGSYRW